MSPPLPSVPRLILFSGLGVGGELFIPQRPISARVETPTWIDPIEAESIRQYALRMAETIEPGDDLFVGGVSFGGMIALEVAQTLQARGVFLSSSGYSYRQIALPIRMIGHAVGAAPIPLLRAALTGAGLLVRVVGRPNRRQRNLVLSLVPKANLKLTRWGGPAIMNWEFRGTLPCPVHQVHGEIDRVVPRANVDPDLTIEGGGHIINVTHAQQVNTFITRHLGEAP